MQLAVLTARPDLEVNQRLLRAAARAGAAMTVLDATVAVASTHTEPTDVAAVLPRIGNWRPLSALAVLEGLEAAGVATPNPAVAIRIGRDHWCTARSLTAARLPVPETVAGSDPSALSAAASDRLGFPVVVKQRRSRMGIGVVRCDHRDHLDAVLDSFWRLGDEVVVQRLVPCHGRSRRLLVVSGRVVAAAELHAPNGDWRSNAARGGSAHSHQPSTDECALAAAAADAVGLGVCGVDLLAGDDRTWVVEVNPSPGFLVLEAASGVDVAHALITDLLARAR
jgi:RimK family alpha-L-glutamate ligase